MRVKILALSLCLFGPLLAAEPPAEEIRIYLSTTSHLEPIYVGKLLSSDGSLSSDYLAQLDSILFFDFSHNGSTKVAPSHEQREKILAQDTPARCFNSQTWKNWGIAHVLKGQVRNKALHISVFSSQTSSLKQFPEITLTGILAKDRGQIHRLADAIYKTLYGEPGVASTRILYAAKQKNNDKWISEICLVPFVLAL